MAAIDLSTVQFYKGGSAVSSGVVGNDYASGAVIRRVARYTIQAPKNGASKISLSFTANQFGDGSFINLRFFIGTDPSSHVNAGAESEFTGEFTLDTTYLKFTAAADFVLSPGKTYYLWIFPAVSTYGWYYWAANASMEAEGSAGTVNICINGETKQAIPRLYTGGRWTTPKEKIYKSGKWNT